MGTNAPADMMSFLMEGLLAPSGVAGIVAWFMSKQEKQVSVLVNINKAYRKETAIPLKKIHDFRHHIGEWNMDRLSRAIDGSNPEDNLFLKDELAKVKKSIGVLIGFYEQFMFLANVGSLRPADLFLGEFPGTSKVKHFLKDVGFYDEINYYTNHFETGAPKLGELKPLPPIIVAGVDKNVKIPRSSLNIITPTMNNLTNAQSVPTLVNISPTSNKLTPSNPASPISPSNSVSSVRSVTSGTSEVKTNDVDKNIKKKRNKNKCKKKKKNHKKKKVEKEKENSDDDDDDDDDDDYDDDDDDDDDDDEYPKMFTTSWCWCW